MSPDPGKSSPYRKILAGIIIVIVGIRLLWLLPIARQVVISFLFPPMRIPLPTLNDPNAITPETVKDVQLLEHWGNGSFESIAWSPDGRYFAIGTTFGFNLYDAKSFELLQNIYIPAVHTFLMSFSPDSSVLALADSEWTVTLFDLRQNKISHQWDMPYRISILTFLEDGALICVTESDDVMRLINDNWQLIKTLDDGFLTWVAFIPEQQALVAVYAESTQIIDPYSGQSRKLSFVVPYGGDLLLSNNIRVEVDRDLSLVSAYADDKLINQITVEERFDQPTPSPQGGIMATLSLDPYSPWGGTVTLWHIPSLEPVRTLLIPEVSTDVGNEIAFSPDGETLAVLASPYIVKIFPTGEDGSLEITLTDQFASIGDIAISPEGKIWTVNCTGAVVEIRESANKISIDRWYFEQPACGEMLDDGISLAISEPYEKMRIYKVRQVTPPVTVNARCCSVFSADGSVGAGSSEVASSGDPVVIGIWHQQLGRFQKWKYYREGYRAFDVAVSSSGQYVAASSSLKTHLYVHGIESGRTYPSLGTGMAFSPDERSLASSFRILDLETGEVIELEDTSDPVCSPESFSVPVFSPDGQVLAVAACSQLRFWRTNNGALLAELDNPYGSYDLQFSPDGTFLVGRGIGSANVWGIKKIAP